MSAIQTLVSHKIRLPSPPLIAIKILETVRSDAFTYRDLAYLIESDPALTARVLKAANTSYYTPACKVTSIEKALALLGTHAVTNIALSFVIVSEFQAGSAGTFDATVFWRRALTAAVAAEMTAVLVGMPHEDIFVIALLHDIGIMVMHSCLPQDYQQVFNLRKRDSIALWEAEQKVFGFNHQQLGAELLQSWQLPEQIYVPIGHHHQSASAPEAYQQVCDILYCADCLASFYSGAQDVEKIRQVKRVLDTVFGLKGTAVDGLVESVAHKTLEMLSSFEIEAGAMRPFSLILQDANEELSNLYDSYELLVIELKQAKEKAEKLAQELYDANNMHRELAFRDGLTGIYNRRFFQESLDLELLRAQRYGRRFSLIIFDVDNFKRINDVFGHTVGDLVLINISKAVQGITRTTDVFARYGGDEFVIVLPESDLATTTVAGEGLRAAVEALTTIVNKVTIQVTISVGVTSFSSHGGLTEREEVISLADKALYIAKLSGKNSVRALSFPEK